MPSPKCLGCDGTSFEVVSRTPRYSNFELLFVQCDKCGGVVGVLDKDNIGASITQVKEKVEKAWDALNRNDKGLEEYLVDIRELLKQIKT